MKKIILYLYLIMLLLFICGCSNNDSYNSPSVQVTLNINQPSESIIPSTIIPSTIIPSTIVQQTPLNDKWYNWSELGAYPATIYENKYLVGDERYIYYSSSDKVKDYIWNNNLYRADLDGSDIKELDVGYINYINCLNGWIYYSKSDGIYKIDYEGNNKKRICKYTAMSMIVNDGEIICRFNNLSGIYIIDKNGVLTKLSSISYNLDFYDIDSNTIYLEQGITDSDLSNIYSYQIDSKKLSLIKENINSKIFIYNDCLYYEGTDDENNWGIICFNPQDQSLKIVSKLPPDDNNIWYINRFEEWILISTYNNVGNDCNLYGYDLKDGETKSLIKGINYCIIDTTPLHAYLENNMLVFRNGDAYLEPLKNTIK